MGKPGQPAKYYEYPLGYQLLWYIFEQKNNLPIPEGTLSHGERFVLFLGSLSKNSVPSEFATFYLRNRQETLDYLLKLDKWCKSPTRRRVLFHWILSSRFTYLRDVTAQHAKQTLAEQFNRETIKHYNFDDASWRDIDSVLQEIDTYNEAYSNSPIYRSNKNPIVEVTLTEDRSIRGVHTSRGTQVKIHFETACWICERNGIDAAELAKVAKEHGLEI